MIADTTHKFSHRVARKLIHTVKNWQYPAKIRTVPIDRLLKGGENSLSAAKFAQLIGDPMLPSRPITESPHVLFLQQYRRIGEAIFEPDIFEQTPYFANARTVIDYTGSYFDAVTDNGILDVARDFVNRFNGKPQMGGASRKSQTPLGAPIIVHPIQYSDCFEIFDGHHRLAIHIARGEKEALVLCKGEPRLTLLQQRLFDIQRTWPQCELDQPIASPELEHWTVPPCCADRFEKMCRFLTENEMLPPKTQTYLDIASSYGWFIHKMAGLGFNAGGVEQDPIAVSIGPMAYGLEEKRVQRADYACFLKNQDAPYDIVSYFNLLQHFVSGRNSLHAYELIRLLDRITGRVLFLDIGQSDEAWFQEAQTQWTPDCIENWLRENTSFSCILRPGIDRDRRTPSQNDSARTLYVCMR